MPECDVRLRVLVVDDDARVRGVLHEALGGAGFAVREAATGVEALVEIERARPDVVVLDLRLPGAVDGHAVLAAVADCPLPVVVLSAYLDEDGSRLPRWAVAEPKPFRVARLPHLLEEALRLVPPAAGDAASRIRRAFRKIDDAILAVRDLGAGGR